MQTPKAVSVTMCGRDSVTLSDGRVLRRPTMAHMIAIEAMKNNAVFERKSSVANVLAIMFALERSAGDVLAWARGMSSDLFDSLAEGIGFSMFDEVKKAVDELFAPMQTMIDAAGSGGGGNPIAATGG